MPCPCVRFRCTMDTGDCFFCDKTIVAMACSAIFPGCGNHRNEMIIDCHRRFVECDYEGDGAICDLIA